MGELSSSSKREKRLIALLADYAEHQSWRCDHPDRYPWEPDCPCGLSRDLREFGLTVSPNIKGRLPHLLGTSAPFREADSRAKLPAVDDLT